MYKVKIEDLQQAAKALQKSNEAMRAALLVKLPDEVSKGLTAALKANAKAEDVLVEQYLDIKA